MPAPTARKAMKPGLREQQLTLFSLLLVYLIIDPANASERVSARQPWMSVRNGNTSVSAYIGSTLGGGVSKKTDFCTNQKLESSAKPALSPPSLPADRVARALVCESSISGPTLLHDQLRLDSHLCLFMRIATE
jgi:hypothetical protein